MVDYGINNALGAENSVGRNGVGVTKSEPVDRNREIHTEIQNFKLSKSIGRNSAKPKHLLGKKKQRCLALRFRTNCKEDMCPGGCYLLYYIYI